VPGNPMEISPYQVMYKSGFGVFILSLLIVYIDEIRDFADQSDSFSMVVWTELSPWQV